MTTEQTNMESAPNEGAGTPSPVSPVSGQQSSAGATGKSELQELREKVERLEREGQSAKDRAISNLKKEVEAKIAELSGKPVEPEKSEPTTVNTDTGTIGGAQALPEALARFTESGLSVSDTDVSALIGKATEFKTREAFLLEAERIINRKSIKPSVTASAAIATSTGTPPGNPTVEALTTEYQNKVIAARGDKNAILRLKAEYKGRGVPVDQVNFTIR